MINRGFTIIEVTTAVFIITVGVVGVFSLIQQVFVFTSVSGSRLVSSYLSQEGIEIVRNIRDSNWLEQRSNPFLLWDDGLPSGNWEADYNSQSLSQVYSATSYLNLDSSGFYSYSLGSPTRFKRKISVLKPQADILEISVEVIWDERGRSHSVTAQYNLYNWR